MATLSVSNTHQTLFRARNLRAKLVLDFIHATMAGFIKTRLLDEAGQLAARTRLTRLLPLSTFDSSTR